MSEPLSGRRWRWRSFSLRPLLILTSVVATAVAGVPGVAMNDLREQETIAGFLPILVRSGLVSPEMVDGFLEQYRESYLPRTKALDSLTSFCSYLVAAGVLTVWQCAKLRDGRWKGFFLENYVLLDRVSGADVPVRCLARRRDDGAYVLLEITPPTPGTSERIQCRLVQEY